ncbi:MAG: RagB/SusD family nutrient uptake outer membrane protein [Nonlabens sp.]|uniref:RagB/SusD family nutrient uptake outer membrane protein n=1 Tax=Nonlabens sp. TaxID=1888209 RepID=UPI003EF206F6
MKKYNLIALFAFTALLWSCNDAIDIDQPGRLDSAAAFQTTEDLELGILNVYNGLDTTNEIGFTSRFTDEIRLGFDNGGQAVGLFSWQLDESNGNASSMWVSSYANILRANLLIEGSANVTAADAAEQAEIDNIVGQAYAIRAYNHFRLLSYFSTDLTDDNAAGVPAVDYIPAFDAAPDRDTNGDVFTLIDADLAFATASITESSNIFFTQDAITALKARMAAYRGQYTVAAPLAQQLLTAYPIANRADYENMFLDQGNAEIIMKLERTIADSYDNQGTGDTGGGWAGSLFAFIGPDLGGSPYLEMGKSLADEFVVGDIRRDVNLIEYAVGAVLPDREVHVVDKYEGSEGVPLMNDLKVFRSSEMLFILAEGRVSQGLLNGPGSAGELLDDLRAQRFGAAQPTVTYANATEAYGDILDERRIELAFEGHRYQDLRRLGALGNREITRDPIDCAINGACVLPVSDFRYTFPIPLAEIQGNQGMRAQQNPGYSN